MKLNIVISGIEDSLSALLPFLETRTFNTKDFDTRSLKIEVLRQYRVNFRTGLRRGLRTVSKYTCNFNSGMTAEID